MERKKAAFAGTWYPDSAHACQQAIQTFLKETLPPDKGRVVAGIVPHAGWVFSGSIACRTIAAGKITFCGYHCAVRGTHAPAVRAFYHDFGVD
jgi:AmmeMemoRadiSam system protein B